MAKQHALLKQVMAFINQNDIILAQRHVVAAVSAGRDSVVMLDILAKLSSNLDFDLAIAHFDHKLRAESAAEQDFVADLAVKYGLPFFAGNADIMALSCGKNIEACAREQRYLFLQKVAAEFGQALIATAHHAHDQAETVLLHLLRGAGLEGLAAISPNEKGLIRPLLNINPQQIEEYRVAHDLQFCQDLSNFDDGFTRNHLRLKTMPILTEYNPQLVKSLNTLADICRIDNQCLNRQAELLFKQYYQSDQSVLSRKDWHIIDPALQYRLIRRFFQEEAQTNSTLSYQQTMAIANLKEEQMANCPLGYKIWRRGDFCFGRKMPPLPKFDQTICPVFDGNWHNLADWGWRYRARPVEDYREALTKNQYIIPAIWQSKLSFRTRKDGDSILALPGFKALKVKDIFIKAHIEPSKRNSWPLILHNNDIIGLPIIYPPKLPQISSGILIELDFLA